MAAVSTAPGIPVSRTLSPYNDEDRNMSTLPDPRNRTMSSEHGDSKSDPADHPDLSSEVATLSNKLINAINYQTNLDDVLNATRHELEASRKRVKELERENADRSDMIAHEVLIRRSAVEAEKSELMESLANERSQREEVEKEKKKIEQELENLTTALFEEANKMVITAREEAQKEHDIVQRRNDQLKTQLTDTENLLKSHQEQLAELKRVLEQMSLEHDDQTNATEPSTPGFSKFDIDELGHDAEMLANSSVLEVPPSPSYPTSFAHLLQPVLRTDLTAYDDFISLLRISKNVVAGSRASSGSYGGISLGLGLGAYTGNQQGSTNASTTSLATTGTFGSSPATPTTPASSISTGSTNAPNSLTPLKETKFYKRTLAEDIEPTLRLDTAPGLSWLARRTVLNAVCEGALVVEPMPSSTKLHMYPCSLCGENRKDPSHHRSHRFRTSESDSAQRHPLCKYCLGRVRSTCDFLGFLRVLKEGHWRTDDEEAEKSAWEESVRLREQMFWRRMGGGVIPSSQSNRDPSRSPQLGENHRMEQEKKLSEEFERTGEIKPKDITPVDLPVIDAAATIRTAHGSEEKADKAAVEGLWQAAQEDAIAPSPIQRNSTQMMVGISELSVAKDNRKSSSSLGVQGVGEEDADGPKGLSITIPDSTG